VVRAQDGSVLAIVSNHSRWLDAVDDERYPFVQRFRGGLVFKAHILLYHSTLGLRVIKKGEGPPLMR